MQGYFFQIFIKNLVFYDFLNILIYFLKNFQKKLLTNGFFCMMTQGGSNRQTEIQCKEAIWEYYFETFRQDRAQSNA